MSDSKRLKILGSADSKLGQATIMDRALAQKHGVAYVHLAVFAIDIDRVRALDPDDTRVPFAFEVALTEAYLVRHFMPRYPASFASILEDAVLAILELPAPTAEQPAPLGSQLAFAVFAGTARGSLPAPLAACFRSWKKPPLALVDDTAPWLEDARIAALADHCLSAELSPPLAQPVRDALLELRG